jgi:hypothetical protein
LAPAVKELVPVMKRINLVPAEVFTALRVVTVMEIFPLLSASVWHIQQMSKPKQYTEILMLTPKKVILKEVKKWKRNGRRGRITV